MAGGGKSKKAPSGKRARRKAKLDRQWGEEVDPSYDKRTSYQRGNNNKSSNKRFSNNQHSTHSQVDDDDNDNADQRLHLNSKRFKYNDSCNRNNHHHDRKGSVSASVSAFDASDTEEEQEDRAIVLDQLLQKINYYRGDKSKSNSKGDDDSMLHQNKTKKDSEDEGSSIVDEYNIRDYEENVADDVTDDVISSDDVSDDDATSSVSNKHQNDDYTSHFSNPTIMMSDDHVFSSDWTTKCDTLVPISKAEFPADMIQNLKLFGHGPILAKLQEEKTWNSVIDRFEKNNRALIRSTWPRFNRNNMVSSSYRNQSTNDTFTPLQSLLYPSLSSYSDLLLTVEHQDNRKEIYDLTILHILNHLMIAQSRIKKHNRRISGTRENAQVSVSPIDDSISSKDQGYTRPKVLVLCPTRGTALSYLKRVFDLAGSSTFVDGLDRLELDFGVNSSENVDTERRDQILKSKGAEWVELFGEDANDDDDFKFGLALCSPGKKKKEGKRMILKLYSDFMHSDLIIASPLALKLHIEREESTDFLSSIEVCSILYGDVLLMQNWDHVNSVLASINKQPKKLNNTDFSRVRECFLAGKGQHWRQTIILSSLKDPNIIGTFKRHTKSIEGRVHLNLKIGVSDASICDVFVKVKHVFQRVQCSLVANQGDAKLKFFSEKVLAQLLRLKQKHTLIYIPSYFDFVAVRNVLLRNSADFVSVTEYARVSEISRGRARFQQGRKNIMLYTGRCHFFKRLMIKGARHVIFFGLPEHPTFYSDIVNSLNNMGKTRVDFDLESPASCLSIFTKYETHCLERIVGTSHCEHIINSDKQVFLFNT